MRSLDSGLGPTLWPGGRARQPGSSLSWLSRAGCTVANQQLLAQFCIWPAGAACATVVLMAKPSTLILLVLPFPAGDKVTVVVTEPGMPGGEFHVSTAAWQRLRRGLTPRPGIRIREPRPQAR
jgi:hypothetical protein